MQYGIIQALKAYFVRLLCLIATITYKKGLDIPSGFLMGGILANYIWGWFPIKITIRSLLSLMLKPWRVVI